MKKQIFKLLSVLTLILSVVACSKNVGTPPKNSGLAYFDVTFVKGEKTGSETKALSEQKSYSFHINITAKGYDDKILKDYNGKVRLSVKQAKISSVVEQSLKNGEAKNVEVVLKRATGEENIAVQEINPKYDESKEGLEPKFTGKVGVSKTIFFQFPTISLVQGTVSSAKGNPSLFNKKNLNIRGTYDEATGKYRDMVVVASIEAGFYLAEVGGKDYNGIYLYTHSSPFVDDRDSYHPLEEGTLIKEVNGSVFEFFGFTELSFPTFIPKREADGKIIVDRSKIPAPVDITSLIDANADSEIEKYESTLVTVKNVTVGDFDEKDESFTTYGQYFVTTQNGGHIMLTTMSTVPQFDPIKNKGKKLKSVTGLLKQHTSARPSTWILIPRNEKDLIFDNN